MTSLAMVIGRGTLASRPAAGTAGALYFVTDTSTLYRDNGSTWESVEGAGGGGGAPTTAQYVTTATDATLSAEVAIPGLAGSSDRAGQGGTTFAEEFDTTTLPLTWTSSNPASQDANTTVPSGLYIHGTDAAERYGYRAFSPAGAFDLRAKVSLGLLGGSSTPLCQIGLAVADATNATRAFVQVALTGGSSPGLAATAFTFASSAFTQRGATWPGGYVLYLRLTRDGSNNLSFYISSDGLAWTLIATQPLTLTVTQAGLRLSASGTSPIYDVVVDWLRAS